MAPPPPTAPWFFLSSLPEVRKDFALRFTWDSVVPQQGNHIQVWGVPWLCPQRYRSQFTHSDAFPETSSGSGFLPGGTSRGIFWRWRALALVCCDAQGLPSTPPVCLATSIGTDKKRNVFFRLLGRSAECQGLDRKQEVLPSLFCYSISFLLRWRIQFWARQMLCPWAKTSLGPGFLRRRLAI